MIRHAGVAATAVAEASKQAEAIEKVTKGGAKSTQKLLEALRNAR
uniref:Uncharacterized protein n=1 Tax=Desertifilum tharense IPPAS B-1220 TaxID=1781255 RepID=A0ACD5GRJ6_9CYAN